MNLTTVLVAVVIAGSATPGIAKMALQPIVAQKRATNFGIAEMQAVTFAAKNEGQMSLTETPGQCQLEDIGDNAFAITCWEGKRKYKMSATRSFRQGTSYQDSYNPNTSHSSSTGTSNEEISNKGTSSEGTHNVTAIKTAEEGTSNEKKRTFPYPTPSDLTHYKCPHFDPWGVVSFNKTHLSGKACIPIPLQSPANFAESNPAEWLYDISGFGM